MRLTAEQLVGAIGPATDECDCLTCKAAVRLQEALTPVVVALEKELNGNCAPDSDEYERMWDIMLHLAIARVAVSGVSQQSMMDAVLRGGLRARKQNPLLCSAVQGNG